MKNAAYRQMKNAAYRQKKEQPPVLAIDKLERLKDLFDSKGWPKDDQSEISVYERYYNTLLMCDDSQQDFLLELSQRFEHIPIGQYLTRLIQPLKRIRQQFTGDNLLFVAGIPKADIGSVKSATAVLYQLKGTSIKQRINLSPYLVVENVMTFQWDAVRLEKTRIVLVDDFVGTGETAQSVVEFIHELLPLMEGNERIAVLCIAAMQSGVERLKNMGVEVFADMVMRKAITDTIPSPQKEKAEQLMQGIETRIKKLKPEYRFGYGQSESLICMERCPNNTFPVYWLMKGVAPYER